MCRTSRAALPGEPAMSVDACHIVLANETAISVPFQTSLTDEQVASAQAALRHLAPEWSLDCCVSCEADIFLDLSSTCADGRCVSFIIHAQDGAIHVYRMVDDDDAGLGSFEDMMQAVNAVIEAIASAPG
jgi:hypothetical protein